MLNFLIFIIMARQKGIIKLKGTIGDITFYKSKDGYMARERGGIDGQRIASDPKFQRTRENGAEFGRAGKSGKVLRTALQLLLRYSPDSRMVSRLTKRMITVLQTDTVSARGSRTVDLGDAGLLEGFEFNIQGALSTSFFAAFESELNRVTGALTISIAPFVPNVMIKAPQGATHFKLVSAGVSANFEGAVTNTMTSSSVILPWDETPTVLIEHTNTVTADTTDSLFLVLGLEFYQEINGDMYPLKNGAYNALSIVKAERSV
jgi:hypothetical protein